MLFPFEEKIPHPLEHLLRFPAEKIASSNGVYEELPVVLRHDAPVKNHDHAAVCLRAYEPPETLFESQYRVGKYILAK